MQRRQFLTKAGLLAGSAAVLPEAVLAAPIRGGDPAPPRLLNDFLALPGNKSVQINIDDARRPWQVTHDPGAPLFCGSAFKTFVLATYLQAVELGRLEESEQLAIDDNVRSVGGGVFEHLTGTTQARNVLEAMIAHSDNTATDVAMRRVGADNVRAFIKSAGLKQVRIPDSTRRFFSYLAGYPIGVDMGWSGLEQMLAGNEPGPPRPAINDQETMVCPAAQFVSYYKRALAGEFFQKKETLTEFKRIQAMANALALVVPPDTAAYGKGGSIEWNDFYCMASAGQMIVDQTPVTFCLTLNWQQSDGASETVVAAYKNTTADILARIHTRLLETRA